MSPNHPKSETVTDQYTGAQTMVGVDLVRFWELFSGPRSTREVTTGKAELPRTQSTILRTRVGLDGQVWEGSR